MLIVDLHTLETVNVLYLVNDVLLNGSRTLNSEDIAWSDNTIRKWSTCTYGIMLLNKNLLRERYEVRLLVACLRCNDDLTITSLNLAHCYLTIDFRYDSRVRRVAGLEELCYSWKTTSDITCTTYGTWNLNQCGTSSDGLTILYSKVTTYREVVCTQYLTRLRNNVYSRNLCTILRISNDLFGHTGCIIGLSTEGDITLYIVELNLTSVFADDNGVEWVPLSNTIALLNLGSILEIERRTIRYVKG